MSSLISPVEQESGAPTAGELADLLAHDLRTPLNAVRGYCELLLSGATGPMTGEAIELLAEIGRAGRALEEAVLCAQELGEPCIMAAEITHCGMYALLVDAGFAIRSRDMSGAVEVVGEALGWRRLLGACRDHLLHGSAGETLWAELGSAGRGLLQLELSAGGSRVAGPASVLRERLMRRLAALQHAALVSELPHRPIRLVIRRAPTGR